MVVVMMMMIVCDVMLHASASAFFSITTFVRLYVPVLRSILFLISKRNQSRFETDVRVRQKFPKERPFFYVRAFFVSYFPRRSLPQIPSGFPSPILPKHNPICHVPIPRNPEELVTIALTSILATGGLSLKEIAWNPDSKRGNHPFRAHCHVLGL